MVWYRGAAGYATGHRRKEDERKERKRSKNPAPKTTTIWNQGSTITELYTFFCHNSI
jgi:hypothetical protein